MRHSSATVAAVQPDSRGTAAEALESAVRLVRLATKSGAKIVCLPEHWIPGDDPNMEDTIPPFLELAKEAGAFVVPGADFSRRGGAVKVESPVLGPQGLIGRQAKTHLFRREKRLAVPGDTLRTFDLGGIRVGITICHDLVYPEVPRMLTLKGAELLLAPAMITSIGYEPWELYVKARAIENRVPVVSPNAIRFTKYQGGSLIVGFGVEPREKIVEVRVLERAGRRPGVISVNLDLRTIRRYREERLAARRPELYVDLSRRTTREVR